MPCLPSYVDKDLIIETALNYLHHGFWPTPVRRGERKGAYLSGWSTKKVTEAKLVAELRRGTNLGIVLGPECGLVCIDIDNKPPSRDGKRWVTENEHRLGSPLIEHTGSGGYHLYYRYPTGKLAADLSGATKDPNFGSRDRKIQTGVEVYISRCQVVTWPSIHPSGNPYSLDSDVTDLRDIDQYDELPAWIVEGMNRTNFAGEATGLNYERDDEELKAARRRLKQHGPAIEGKGGDHHTYVAACIGHDFAIPPDEWLRELVEWNNACVPPWTTKGLQNKVRSAYKSAKGGIGHKTQKAITAQRVAEFPDDLRAETPCPAEPNATPPADPGPPPDSDDPYDYAEPVPSANRFLATFEGLVTVGPEVHYVYRQQAWQRIERAELKQMLFQRIAATTDCRKLKDNHKNEILKALDDLTYRPNPEFDVWLDGRPGEFLRLANGILNLDSLTLEPHSPNWFSAVKVSFAYDPRATCARWDSFLESCFPDRPDTR